ncbi:Dixin [Trichoplax sp. H2]|nr:Dixin [Trichoplax sp. H2]|eukprot:RDD44504.1 Dixin [Trichoplax sp. H2]
MKTDTQYQQIVTYTLWINSQLKKISGQRQIYQFQDDLRDGVALAQLIAALSGEILPGIDNNPETIEACQNNVDRVLQFMAAKRMQMHRTVAKDIVDGNIKATMRLVLAIAAHYKPHSVKQSSYTNRSAYHSSTLDRHTSYNISNDGHNSDKSARRAQSSTDNYLSAGSTSQLLRNGLSTDSVPSSDASGRRRSKSPSRKKLPAGQAPKVIRKKSFNHNDSSDDNHNRSQDAQYKYVTASVHQISPSRNSYNSDDRSQNSTPGLAVTDDQIILQHSPIQDKSKSRRGKYGDEVSSHPSDDNSMSNSASLEEYYKNEILTYRKELISLQGTLSELRNKLTEQQDNNFKLQKQLLDRDLENQRLMTERKLLESKRKDNGNHKRRNSFTGLDDTVQYIASTELDRSNSKVRLKTRQLYLTLQEYAACEGQIDVGSVRALMDDFAKNLAIGDDQERIKARAQSKLPAQEIDAQQQFIESEDDEQTVGSYQSKADEIINNYLAEQSNTADKVTKVSYHLEGETKPSTFLIHKRLGQITFGDFKKILNFTGYYHYYFKELDPEFGTVKKELFDDDDILPGWEGNIMAWIEEGVTV